MGLGTAGVVERRLRPAIEQGIDNLSAAVRSKKARLDQLRPMSEPITVGGKTLNEQLETVDHYDAVLWMRELVGKAVPVGETTVRDCIAGSSRAANPISRVSTIASAAPRGITGHFPNPLIVPGLMREFDTWLEQTALAPGAAFEAHFRLTAIHPFSDGNGRTARLLMNLQLIRSGHVPMTVRPEDRKRYLDALERGSLADDLRPFRPLWTSA